MLHPSATRPAPVLVLAFTSELGGAERSTLEATARLDRARFEPILALPGEGPLAEAARQAGIDVVFDGTPHLGRLDPVSWFRVVRRLAAIIQEREVAIIHAGTLWRLSRAAALAKLTGRIAICHVRDEHVATFRSWRFQWAARQVERLVAISSSVLQELVAAGVDPSLVSVLPNGIDPRRFRDLAGRARLRAEWGVPADAPLVGLVGSLEPRKGQLDFIRAAAHVLMKFPAARFVIVGSDLHGAWGDHGAAVEREIAERGLAERCMRVGRHEDVPAVMAALDLLAVPSHREPFGRVVVEAMAASRPVVGYAVGGIKEIVLAGRTGLLCEPGDASELAEALLTLLEDPVLARSMGEAGRARVEQCYTLERHVADLEKLYDDLLERS